ncbi:MAG TPA: hypothetical protein VI893_00525 [Thermoplasmata archaeon]|nr:hypothetical protein [Thermoplasmata archaeon]
MDLGDPGLVDSLLSEVKRDLDRQGTAKNRDELLFHLIEAVAEAGAFDFARAYVSKVDDPWNSAVAAGEVVKFLPIHGRGSDAVKVVRNSPPGRPQEILSARAAEGFSLAGDLRTAMSYLRSLAGRGVDTRPHWVNVEPRLALAEVSVKLGDEQVLRELLNEVNAGRGNPYESAMVQLVAAADSFKKGRVNWTASLLNEALRLSSELSAPEAKLHSAAVSERVAARLGFEGHRQRAGEIYQDTLRRAAKSEQDFDRALLHTSRAMASFGDHSGALATLQRIVDPNQQTLARICVTHLMAMLGAPNWESSLGTALRQARSLRDPLQRGSRLANIMGLIAGYQWRRIVIPCGLTSIVSVFQPSAGT